MNKIILIILILAVLLITFGCVREEPTGEARTALPSEPPFPEAIEKKCIEEKEICDGKDNDCDGRIDEGNLCLEVQECIEGSCKQKEDFFISEYLTPEEKINKIRENIKKRAGTWEAGINPIFLKSYDEKKMLCGLKGEPPETQQKPIARGKDTDLPDFFDWRNTHGYDYITPIKDQSSCGSCWAFGAVAALEGHANAYYNNPVIDLDLSEQDLISCYISDGCCGANDYEIEELFSSYFQNVGIAVEGCFNYGACDAVNPSPCLPSDCSYEIPCSNKCTDWQEDAWKTTGYQNISLNIEDIKQALMNYGPVEVGMTVYDDFFAYSGGIYHHTTETIAGYHAVTIVGFGVYDGMDYWIVKNSWGTDWGEDGYFRIKFGDSMIDSWLAFAVTEPNPPEIQEVICEDIDGDGYCNWGIGPKPDNCSETCVSIEDCDDSNASIFEDCGVNPEPTGFLSITSIPLESKVYVKDLISGEWIYRGITPIEIELNVGEREVKLHELGYLDYNTNVTIQEGETIDLNISLERDPIYQEGWPVEVPEDLFHLTNTIVSDLDNDGKKELIFSSSAPYWSTDSKIYVYDYQGNIFNYEEGWPVALGSAMVFLSVGNVNSDNEEEIIASPTLQCSNDKIYILDINANIINTISFDTAGQIIMDKTLPVLGNLDNDKELEIIMAVNYSDYSGFPVQNILYAWNYDGSSVEGWPVELDIGGGGTVEFNILSAPAIGNIDASGKNEVVIALSNLKKIYAISNTGQILWSTEVENLLNWITFPITLGDINNDGHLEILAYGSISQADYYIHSIYAWDHQGNPLSDWPVSYAGHVLPTASLISLGDLDNNDYLEVLSYFKAYSFHGNLFSEFYPDDFEGYETVDYGSVIGDIDGDNSNDVVRVYKDKVYAFNNDGSIIANWPRELETYADQTPALSDLDGDGDIELIVVDEDPIIYVFDLNEDYNELNIEWPMYANNPQHTNLYTPCPGDVTKDGVINCTDAQWILEMVVGSIPINACGDVSGDGNVTAYDASLLMQQYDLICCEDWTPNGQCSYTKPLYCDNGELINNCQECGCPPGTNGCCKNGSCAEPPLACPYPDVK